MAINILPGLYNEEFSSLNNATNENVKIPVFIGTSPNTGSATTLLKYKSFDEANKTVANGGLLKDNDDDETTNILFRRVKEFFEENIVTAEEDFIVPYIYVVDLGESEDVTSTSWATAIATSFTKMEIELVSLVGIPASSELTVAEAVATLIDDEFSIGYPRRMCFTKESGTDSQLKAFTDDSQTNFIQDARVGLIIPALYGKFVARLCLTPHDVEPGFLKFRSVTPGTFASRSREDKLALQNAGIIFGVDEETQSEIYPKIDLGVSTAFAAENRPNDSLFHAGFNMDKLMREVLELEYPFIKDNETTTVIQRIQSKIDKLIKDKIEAGSFKEGTSVKVKESTLNPYFLENEVIGYPVNHIHAIKNKFYVGSAGVKIAMEE